MKIFYDYKIFYKQVRGGPSRLFLSLAKNLLQYDCNIKIYAPFHFNEFLNQDYNLKLFGTSIERP